MAFVFHRRLALPVGAMMVCIVALFASPRVTPLLAALLGIAVIAVAIQRLAPLFRPGRPAAPTPEGPDAGAAQDALDLVRMDDDGGWQMARR
jgi:hypothetical protein